MTLTLGSLLFLDFGRWPGPFERFWRFRFGGAGLPPSLAELYLHENQIGDEGAKAIGAGLPPSLVKLILYSNQIGDEGAKAIGAGLPPSLGTLYLHENQIGDEGAQAVRRAWGDRPEEGKLFL